MSSKTFEFQAETQELLNLMIHSLYSNREIFLRELVSNSSDAIDKLKFESLTHPEWLDEEVELGIQINLNKENRTLTISDKGIGMTADEIKENIGTIAHSGTKPFLEIRKELKENS